VVCCPVSKAGSAFMENLERGVVEGNEFYPNPMSYFNFFQLFFYHVFIVFRYKKLRAALAMERTKPKNQNKQQKKPCSSSFAVTEITLRLKPFAYYFFRR